MSRAPFSAIQVALNNAKLVPVQLIPGAYKPPDVWKWEQKSGGKFANINRPIAGPTHEKKLPLGEHGLQLYSLGTPNGVKVYDSMLTCYFYQRLQTNQLVNKYTKLIFLR